MKLNRNTSDTANYSAPLFVKLYLIISIILYLFNIFIPFISLIFANIPYYTLIFFNIWRLITNPFITTNLLSIIFSLFFWCEEAVKLERKFGTVKYMLIFFMNAFFIQIIYTFLILLFSLCIRSMSLLKIKIRKSGIRNDGLWPILLCEITSLCLRNPEELKKFYCFSFSLKMKYYPLILLSLFTIISGFRIDIEILCGIGFAFLFHFNLKKKLSISNEFIKKIQDSPLCKWMKNLNGFCPGEIIPEIKNNIEDLKNSTINEIIGMVKNKIKNFKGKVSDVEKETVDIINENKNKGGKYGNISSIGFNEINDNNINDINNGKGSSKEIIINIENNDIKKNENINSIVVNNFNDNKDDIKYGNVGANGVNKMNDIKDNIKYGNISSIQMIDSKNSLEFNSSNLNS